VDEGAGRIGASFEQMITCCTIFICQCGAVVINKKEIRMSATQAGQKIRDAMTLFFGEPFPD